MKRDFFPKIIFLVIACTLLTGIEKSSAIPAFARKYSISCQVCHSPATPRLKAFGEEFAGNGFRLTEYEAPRHFLPTGDDRLSLFREVPLAVRIDGFATYNFNNEGSVDFGSPFVVKILSGGELSDKLSYYFYFLLNERGTIAGLEDAILVYSNLLNSGINFTIGQYQASDPLFKSETRYTIEPYKIYDTRPGNSGIALKYERGILIDRGFSTGTTLLMSVVNGSGIGEAGEGFVFDRDPHKNFIFRFLQEIGAKLSAGFYAYTGKEDLLGAVDLFQNDVLIYGPDLRLNFDDKFVLNMQYLRRTDSEVYSGPTSATSHDVNTHGGFAEIIYSPKGDMSTWYLTGLVNLIDSDMDALDYRSATMHAGYLVKRNFKAVGEYTWNFAHQKYGKVSAGFVMAF